MKSVTKLTFLEMKLFFRDPATWVVSLLLPTIVLLILSTIPNLRTVQEIYGGYRFIDLFVPSLVVVTLATLGVNTLPIRLATHRERGVLRRLSTTPANPAALLAAQLTIYMVMATAAALLLIITGRLVADVPLPQHAAGFVVAFFLGMSSLFSLGLLVAAVAPSARAGTALSLPLYFLAMFLGGVYLPRVFLPASLVRIGSYMPPGVQALLDAWLGTPPQPLQLGILLGITLLAGMAAARWFRWE